MAEPLRKNQDYDSNDENPVTRPHLGAIDGGGEGNRKPAGNLKVASPEQIDGAERSGLRAIDGGGEGDGQARGSLSAVGDDEEGLYKGSDKKRKPRSLRDRLGKWTKKKTTAVAVTAVVGGGSIFSLSVLQGPMQLLQVSQLIQKFHLSQRGDETNSRVVKMGRYMYHIQKDGSGIQNTRLGVLGNKYADRIEAKMNESGLETAYTQKSGYRVGYIIDPDNLTGTDLEKYRTFDKNGKVDYDRTTKRVEAAIKREFKDFDLKVNVQNDGTLSITSNDEKFFQSYKLQRYILNKSGYSKSVSAMNARVMAKRAGISLHPIKKLDRKLTLKGEDLYKKWRDERKAARKNGDGEKISPRTSTPEGGAEATEAAEEFAEDANEASESDEAERQSKVDKLYETKGFKAAAGAGAAIGLACLIKDVDSAAEGAKESQIVLPAMRIAGDYLGGGAQVQSGHDIDMKQAGFFYKQLSGVDSSGKKSNWNKAEPFRAEQNKTGGTKPPATLSTLGEGSPFSFINEGAVGTATGIACSGIAQAATVVLGVALGPISFAAGTVLGAALGPIVMNQLVDWISGQALNLMPVGADLGSTIAFGGHLMGRSQGISTGGRELSATETVENNQIIDEESKSEIASKSFAYRMFSTSDYRSVASQVIGSSQFSTQGLATAVTTPFDSIASTFANIAGRKTNASGAYNYGNVKDVGFSRGELNNNKIENPFVSANQVIQNILPAHPDYIERAKTCFGVELDPASYDVISLQAGSPTLKDTKKDECTDKSDDYLQFRTYILDTITMMSLACLESDDTKPEDAEGTQACNDLSPGGSTNSSNSTPVGSSGPITIKKLDNPIPGASCNCTIEPKGITLHWWAFGGERGKGIKPLVDAFKSNGLSSQLGITSDGEVWQMTEKLNTQANHAIGANSTTIGIEIAGDASQFGRKGIEEYPEKFDAVVKTVKYLVQKYNIPLDGSVNCGNVVGIHPHLAYNKCPGAVEKDDIDDYYFNEVMKRVRDS